MLQVGTKGVFCAFAQILIIIGSQYSANPQLYFSVQVKRLVVTKATKEAEDAYHNAAKYSPLVRNAKQHHSPLENKPIDMSPTTSTNTALKVM